MARIVTMILALALVAACGGGGGGGSNPLQPDEEEDGGGGSGGGETPTENSRGLPPGTSSPTPRSAIFRTEPQNLETGDGFANDFEYIEQNDTFYVDGLAFDGDQPLNQNPPGVAFSAAPPGQIRPTMALYEAPGTHPDFLTGDPITQFQHRALYGVSPSGNVELAIVRTGAYIDYGFGGWIYQRNNGVTLPQTGQALYTGDYGALRDFNGAGGLEYATGDMEMEIDFGGFAGNCSTTACDNAIRGYVRNRRIFDANGTDITADYITAINANADTPITELPVITLRIGPNVMDGNGEVVGEAFNTVDGEEFMSGKYYAVLSGNHRSGAGGEIVGIMVLTGDDPRQNNVTVRETGGFIVTRGN